MTVACGDAQTEQLPGWNLPPTGSFTRGRSTTKVLSLRKGLGRPLVPGTAMFFGFALAHPDCSSRANASILAVVLASSVFPAVVSGNGTVANSTRVPSRFTSKPSAAPVCTVTRSPLAGIVLPAASTTSRMSP